MPETLATSPGRWNRLVPRDEEDNVAWRSHITAACLKDPSLRDDVWEMCKEDILFYVSSFVWQYNPDRQGFEAGPFIPWDFQERAILKVPGVPWNASDLYPEEAGILWCIENGEDLLAHKSRKMGASWLFLIVMEWMWHFHGMKKFLCVSKSEDAVDSKDPDSLFWKIDFIHRHLPDWLRPKTKRVTNFFGNEVNDSSITGVASTGDAGVGGRATAMFIDEFALIKKDDKLWAHSAQTSRCRIVNGTHRGLNTMLYKLSRLPSINKLTMHWTQHPDNVRGLYRSTGYGLGWEVLDKTYSFPADFDFNCSGTPSGGPRPQIRSPWYDRQCERMGGSWAVAMDLDIDPQGSSHQYFDAVVIKELISTDCRPPLWVGDLEYDRDSAHPYRLVENKEGLVKLWITPDGNGKPPKAKYGFGADVSLGTGATPSCLTGGDGATGQKVFEYVNAFIGAEDFAVLMVAVGRLFYDGDNQGAMLCWEADGPGLKTGMKILELGYRQIYYRVDEFKDNMRYRQKRVVADRPGWTPNAKGKLVLLESYKRALRERQFVNRSEEALDQCLMFEFDSRGGIAHGEESSKGNPSGARVNHGDLVIADALAWKMMREVYREVEAEQESVLLPNTLAWRMKKHDTERREYEEA